MLYNLDIERAILNSIIQDNDKFKEVSNILTSKDFYNPFHQTVYQKISELLKEQDFFDEFILREELEKSKYFDETEG
jgi:replicative DNA helicase